MNPQLILVILIIAGAVSFLGLRFYKLFSGKSKSGDCPNCGVADTKKIQERKI